MCIPSYKTRHNINSEKANQNVAYSVLPCDKNIVLAWRRLVYCCETLQITHYAFSTTLFTKLPTAYCVSHIPFSLCSPYKRPLISLSFCFMTNRKFLNYQQHVYVHEFASYNRTNNLVFAYSHDSTIYIIEDQFFIQSCWWDFN